jgi:hypothetical protein
LSDFYKLFAISEYVMNTETQSILGDKKIYSSPKLVNYGDVRSLTQAAASGSNEGSGGMNPNMASDRLVKENIVQIGCHPLGFGLYLFDYKPEYCGEWGYGRQFGVMADEVEAVMPEAVGVHPDDYKMVNYTMLGITQRTH